MLFGIHLDKDDEDDDDDVDDDLVEQFPPTSQHPLEWTAQDTY